jgi:phosphate starvation-inducible PhoH-like protein
VHQRRKYFPIRYITNVEEVGEKQAQCIMVEDESHLYLTNNCIVTHNTYLAVLAALNLLQQKKIKKIVYIRSIVESAEKSIGALPGELDEKFKPWSLPMLDKLHELLSDAATDALLNNGTVQCIPVNFVRGLTFHDSVVIVDESQNLSRKELVSILTRFGHNSRFIIAGDLKQNDIAKSGYKEVLERFNDEESVNNHIHCVHFGQNEIVRSHILKFIVRKLEC